MKRFINSATHIVPEENIIRIVMYLRPIIYDDAEFLKEEAEKISASVYKDNDEYHTDINPERRLNGPLSNKGEQLGSPLKEEWDSFLEDCKFLVKENGFTIIDKHRSEESKKSEYLIIFGMNDNPCGSLVFDLRISDHPFDVTFPEEYKEKALKYLKINKILDESASKAGIDFCVEKVLVGNVKHDSWDKAFHRVDQKLDQIRRRIRKRLSTRNK